MNYKTRFIDYFIISFKLIYWKIKYMLAGEMS